MVQLGAPKESDKRSCFTDEWYIQIGHFDHTYSVPRIRFKTSKLVLTNQTGRPLSRVH